MISKETLHRLLVELDKQYGNSANYFTHNPYNDVQQKLFELNALCDEHKLQVNWKHRIHRDLEENSHDVSDMFDIRSRLIDARSPDDYHVIVYSTEEGNAALTPDSELFQQIAKLHVETEGYAWLMPTDVITIDDMSFTVHDILVAINEHAEPHRLNKRIVIDRYVHCYESEDLNINSSVRYSDELIDEIEAVANKIVPYWNGTKPFTYPESDDYVQWENIFNGEKPVLSEDNLVYLACNKPDKTIYQGNIPALTNLVDYMCESESFVGIMMIRAITQSSISISYKDVPRFKDFVTDNSLYVREIRSMS